MKKIFVMKLNEKISKIEKEYKKKEKEAIESLNEERSVAIAKTIFEDCVENLGKLPVGDIMYIFENICDDVLLTKNGAKAINTYTKLVKENKALNNIYYLRNCINESAGNKDIIDEAFSLVNMRGANYNESRNKLAECVAFAMAKINPSKVSKKLSIPEDEHRLNENIAYISGNDKNIKNLNEWNNRYNEIISYKTKKNDELNESKFKEEKTRCIEAIDKAWEIADSELRIKLTEMKDRLTKKEFSSVTAEEDIKTIIELRKTVG